MWALLISSVVAVTAPEMVARTLDGREVLGVVVELKNGRVVIKTGEKTVTIEADAILSLKPKTPPQANSTGSALYRVELVDGSRLVIDDYTVTNGQVRLTLRGRSEQISSRAVSVVRFKQGTKKIDKQWAEILANRDAKKTSGDVIVIRKGENVDSLEGEFQDVVVKGGKKFVQFDLGEGAVDVAFDRVDGMVYFHAAPPRFDDPVCVVTDADEAQLRVKSIVFSDGKLELETLAGLKTARALEQVKSLDFSAGKVMYLAVGADIASDELAPLRVVTPKYAIQPGKPNPDLLRTERLRSQMYLRKNSWGVNPLKLRGQEYSRGLAAWSGTQLEYPLRKKYRRFHAIIGIDDWAQGGGGYLRLIIKGDGKSLVDIAVTAGGKPETLDLDISGYSRLSIIIDYGKQDGGAASSVGDALDLCNARVTK